MSEPSPLLDVARTLAEDVELTPTAPTPRRETSRTPVPTAGGDDAPTPHPQDAGSASRTIDDDDVKDADVAAQAVAAPHEEAAGDAAMEATLDSKNNQRRKRKKKKRKKKKTKAKKDEKKTKKSKETEDNVATSESTGNKDAAPHVHFPDRIPTVRPFRSSSKGTTHPKLASSVLFAAHSSCSATPSSHRPFNLGGSVLSQLQALALRFSGAGSSRRAVLHHAKEYDNMRLGRSRVHLHSRALHLPSRLEMTPFNVLLEFDSARDKDTSLARQPCSLGNTLQMLSKFSFLLRKHQLFDRANALSLLLDKLKTCNSVVLASSYKHTASELDSGGSVSSGNTELEAHMRSVYAFTTIAPILEILILLSNTSDKPAQPLGNLSLRMLEDQQTQLFAHAQTQDSFRHKTRPPVVRRGILDPTAMIGTATSSGTTPVGIASSAGKPDLTLPADPVRLYGHTQFLGADRDTGDLRPVHYESAVFERTPMLAAHSHLNRPDVTEKDMDTSGGHSFFNEDLQRYLPSSKSAATVFSQAPGTGLRQLVPEVDVPRARHSSARKPEDKAQSGGSQVLEDRIARFAQSHPPVSKDMVPEPQNVEDSDDEDEKDAQSARQDEESSAGTLTGRWKLGFPYALHDSVVQTRAQQYMHTRKSGSQAKKGGKPTSELVLEQTDHAYRQSMALVFDLPKLPKLAPALFPFEMPTDQEARARRQQRGVVSDAVGSEQLARTATGDVVPLRVAETEVRGKKDSVTSGRHSDAVQLVAQGRAPLHFKAQESSLLQSGHLQDFAYAYHARGIHDQPKTLTELNLEDEESEDEESHAVALDKTTSTLYHGNTHRAGAGLEDSATHRRLMAEWTDFVNESWTGAIEDAQGPNSGQSVWSELFDSGIYQPSDSATGGDSADMDTRLHRLKLARQPDLKWESSSNWSGSGFLSEKSTEAFDEAYKGHFAKQFGSSTQTEQLKHSAGRPEVLDDNAGDEVDDDGATDAATRHASSGVEMATARVVDQATLVQHVLSVLQGTPSDTFPLVKRPDGELTFETRPCRLLSCSVGSMKSLLTKLAYYGSVYRCLEQFAEACISTAQFGGGQIKQAFAQAVLEFLRLYRSRVMDVTQSVNQRRQAAGVKSSTANPVGVIDVLLHTNTIRAQLLYVGELCRCMPKTEQGYAMDEAQRAREKAVEDAAAERDRQIEELVKRRARQDAGSAPEDYTSSEEEEEEEESASDEDDMSTSPIRPQQLFGNTTVDTSLPAIAEESGNPSDTPTSKHSDGRGPLTVPAHAVPLFTPPRSSMGHGTTLSPYLGPMGTPRVHGAAAGAQLTATPARESAAKRVLQAAPDAFHGFPKGAALLTYLFEIGRENGDPTTLPVVRFLFKRALQPYLTMLTQWVYAGRLVDPCGEFMVGVREEYLGLDHEEEVQLKPQFKRERRTWVRVSSDDDDSRVSAENFEKMLLPAVGWSVSAFDEVQSVGPAHPEFGAVRRIRRMKRFFRRDCPSFMKDIERQVFACGRYMYLLLSADRAYFSCCAVVPGGSALEHFLQDSLPPAVPPPARMCLSVSDIEKLREDRQRVVFRQRIMLAYVNANHREARRAQREEKQQERSREVQEAKSRVGVADAYRAEAAEAERQKKKQQMRSLDQQIEENNRIWLQKQAQLKKEELRRQEYRKAKRQIVEQQKRRLLADYERQTKQYEQEQRRLTWRAKRVDLGFARLSLLRRLQNEFSAEAEAYEQHKAEEVAELDPTAPFAITLSPAVKKSKPSALWLAGAPAEQDISPPSPSGRLALAGLVMGDYKAPEESKEDEQVADEADSADEAQSPANASADNTEDTEEVLDEKTGPAAEQEEEEEWVHVAADDEAQDDVASPAATEDSEGPDTAPVADEAPKPTLPRRLSLTASELRSSVQTGPVISSAGVAGLSPPALERRASLSAPSSPKASLAAVRSGVKLTRTASQDFSIGSDDSSDVEASTGDDDDDDSEDSEDVDSDEDGLDSSSSDEDASEKKGAETPSNVDSRSVASDDSWDLPAGTDEREAVERAMNNGLVLEQALQQSLIASLSAQHRMVNTACLSLLFEKCRLLKHFETLRSFFMMDAGNVMDYFARSLFEGLLTIPPTNWHFAANLNHALSTAIKRCGLEEDDSVFHGLVSVGVSWDKTQAMKTPAKKHGIAPAHLASLGLGSVTATIDHGIDAFSHVKLVYNTPWPVGAVVQPMSIQKYNHVFSFLLRVKRVTHELKSLWLSFKAKKVVWRLSRMKDEQFASGTHAQLNRSAARGGMADKRWQSYEHRKDKEIQRTITFLTPQEARTHTMRLHKLDLVRSQMQHLMDTLQGYIITQVLQVSWQEFRRRIPSARSIFDLADMHDEYLEKIIHRCFLGTHSSVVMGVIDPIFTTILQFKSELEYHDLNAAFPVSTWAKLAQKAARFKQYSQFLYMVLDKMADRGYQQMQQMVLRLDFSEWFKREREKDKQQKLKAKQEKLRRQGKAGHSQPAVLSSIGRSVSKGKLTRPLGRTL